MLRTLHIENMAVIERADMEPCAGFNVLTGETGAGKSIVIDALSAVLGARVSHEMVRTGAKKALITAQFSAEGTEDWLRSQEIEPDDEGVFITRSISPDGKSSCRVNGTPVPVSALRELGVRLLDIHGQTDGQRMADERYHLGFLDGFGGLSDDADKCREKYRLYDTVRKELEALCADESERERKIDSLKFQIGEIERANISPGETETLTSRRELLKNAARITDAVMEAFSALNGGERSDGAVSLLSEAAGSLRYASRWSDELGGIGDRLSSVLAEAEDLSAMLRDFRDGLDFSPNELDEIENRLSLLRRLSRKYGADEKAVLAYLEKCRGELADTENSDERAQELENELEKLKADAISAAEKLSEKRKNAAVQLKARITAELKALSMPGAVFDVEIVKTELTASGIDSVRFLLAANAGEAPGRIAKIASGGELSRIMLAMKTVLAASDSVGAMVFDEIDTGVSGIAASRVAEKLAGLAKNRQVICVTHLPQLAAMADAHFNISKTEDGGRTYTLITGLDAEGRAAEIARLTGGDTATETTLSAARELLSAAWSFKKGL